MRPLAPNQYERKNEAATTAPMSTIRQYINGFNKGDPETMASAFLVPSSILDDMAPHAWQGPTASQDWHRAVLIEGEHNCASGYFVSLGEPLHNDVTGDAAYVVVPATMTFSVHGQKITQTGAIFTVALRKLAGEWRITAWECSKGTRE